MNSELPSSKAARAIRVLMTDRKLSIEGLSEATGIAHSTLKRRLRGMSSFTIDELVTIASHFEVPITAVLLSPFDSDAPLAAVASHFEVPTTAVLPSPSGSQAPLAAAVP